MKQQPYSVALYLRLSRDDPGAGESGSIQTQRTMLETYCREQGIAIYDTYIDDGFSGLNFDRPGFQRMLEDIRSGLVNMVITKDLSRLGRDYIQTGHYTEVFFPRHGVRYIALGDGVDTIRDDNDIAPFKNILNDMYAKDLSRKVKSAKRTRASQGAFIGSHPPYGYKTQADNCSVLEVDEETAPVVRRIFHMALGGTGAVGIAKALRCEKVLTPSAYKVAGGDTRFARLYKDQPQSKRYRWAYTTVHRILTDRVYIGHMVSHKSQVLSYKTKQRATVPKPERIVVESTHPPLVSKDDFERVQRLIASRYSPVPPGRVNLFRGYLYCDECGHRMSLATKVYLDRETTYYRCMHHYHHPEECTGTHFIRYDDLYGIVWQDFRRIAELLSGRIDDITRILYENDVRGQEMQKRKAQKSRLQGRLSELDGIIQKLFEDGVSGKLSPENRERMLEQYQLEQQEIGRRLDAITREIESWDDSAARYKELRAVVKKYLNADELNPWIIGELIDKIHVGQARKTGNGREQDIRIEYLFAGEIPNLGLV